jgi:hypothetical protein
MAEANRALNGNKIPGFPVFLAGTIVALLFLGFLAGCGGNENTGTAATADLSIDTGGRMHLPETSFDFGSIPVGQKVEHEFTIRNTGTGPLELGQLTVKRLEGC